MPYRLPEVKMVDPNIIMVLDETVWELDVDGTSDEPPGKIICYVRPPATAEHIEVNFAVK